MAEKAVRDSEEILLVVKVVKQASRDSEYTPEMHRSIDRFSGQVALAAFRDFTEP